MSYKIIEDSCLDLTEELKKDPHFQMISLTLQVNDVQVIDDEAFDQKKFLAMMRANPNCPKAVCPSSRVFKGAYEYDAESIFVIILSSNLSDTHSSTMLAEGLYEEEHGKENIAVIDSWSASSEELNIRLMIRDLCEQGMLFEEVMGKAMQHTQRETKTYFILESLDTLRKNGWLSGLQTFLVTTPNTKSAMGADKGNVIKLDQARGTSRTLVRICGLTVREAKNPGTLRVTVVHCNNEARAQPVKGELSERAPFKKIIVAETARMVTVYADDGGIILALQEFDRIWWCLE